MKKLTEQEFRDRAQEVMNARKIFIDSGMTKNISLAFELYQKVLAEEERQIFLSTQVYGSKPHTKMDKYERPKCPECDADMMFRPVPENDERIKVQLVCSNKDCDTVLNSENDLSWWQENLKIKDE